MPSLPPRLSIAPIIPTLLPHLDTLNLHLSAILPRRHPLVPRLPKLQLRNRAAVCPGLAADTISKPAVRAADGKIENQVEGLVEGRRDRAIRPGVDGCGAVGVGWREVADVPGGLVELGVEDLVDARVDVGEEIFFWRGRR